MIHTKKIFSLLPILLIAIFVVTNVGCQQNQPTLNLPGDKPVTPEQTDLQRVTEVQLVEQMARARNNYIAKLQTLQKFYTEQGNDLKSSWALQEIDYIKYGPRHPFVVVAEVAGPNLKAVNHIAAADKLYQQGMKYFKKGRGVLGIISDKKQLYLAIDTFNKLISLYPSSDKIDDAAFQIAEIYNHYLKDYTTALLYYYRTWQWDKNTPWPSRFEVAQIYDKQLHNRAKALEFYHKVLELEPGHVDHDSIALERINEIRKVMPPAQQ